MNKLPLAKRTQILAMLCEGSSMRSISRVADMSINTVSMPTRPSVAIKANASGTPAKFDATPEKVINIERTNGGSPPMIDA